MVAERLGAKTLPVQWNAARDVWWQDAVAGSTPVKEAEPLDAEHPLFILYTSGTTGKPKGVLHTTGGYLVQAYITSKWVFDLRDDDVYWCTADVGWVTGHSYLVYGPLANGVTAVMYEGAPQTPDFDRFWKIVEDYNVTILYTAPTAIRTFMKWGDSIQSVTTSTSLRLLGTVGEPINPEAWMWYHRVIGGDRCPIVDTWWQTETGGIMLTPLPGAIATKPGSATLPLPGIDIEVVDSDGKPVRPNDGGLLVIRQPWPGMLRTIYGDPERFKEAYWSRIPGMYFAGDGARRDEDGYFWVIGRIDDVMNVSGHRIGSMEVESALVSHPAVTEAAVVGRPDDIKGQALAAFVTLGPGYKPSDALREEIRSHVGKEIGSLRQARRNPLHRRSAEDAKRQDHASPASRHRVGQRDGGRHDDARRLLRARQTAHRRGLRVGLAFYNTLTRTQRTVRAAAPGPGVDVRLRRDGLRFLPRRPRTVADLFRQRRALPALARLRSDLRPQHHRHRRQDHPSRRRAGRAVGRAGEAVRDRDAGRRGSARVPASRHRAARDRLTSRR